MYLDSLKVYNIALSAKDVLLEAAGALGPMGATSVQLGCARCSREALVGACEQLDDYHPCSCTELMSGGLGVARTMGWLRGSSSEWAFHAFTHSPATCAINAHADAAVTLRTGFCCRD